MNTLLKALFTLSLFVSFSVTTKAQQLYSNYIDSTSQWQDYMTAYHQAFSCPTQFASTYSHFTYTIDGDTVFDGLKYHKVMSHRIDSVICSDGSFSHTNEYFRFFMGLAEDSTKKVFSVDGSRGRQVMWDFGASDTSFCETLSSIDTIWLGNEPRRVFHCDCGSSVRYVIEGIGANTGITGGTSCAIGHHGGTRTICYQKNGFQVSLDSIIPCRLVNVTSIKQPRITSTKSLKIIPNPNQGAFRITFAEQNGSVRVLDQTGRVVFSSRIKTNELIQLNNFSKGVYTILVTTTTQVYTSRIIINE